MILNGVSVTPTSTYPYTSIGPIDFSNLNFVKSSQIDYYYGYASGTWELLSEVKQSYDPAVAFVGIILLSLAFLWSLWFVIRQIKKY